MTIAEPPPAVAAAAGIPRGTSLEDIPIALVDVGVNVRSSDALGDLEELAESIRQHGVLQPVRVILLGASGRYRLVYGQRRLLAAAMAGLDRIPALVDGVPPDGDLGVQQLVENIQRNDLAPLDEARALQRLLAADPKLTQAALAKRIGRSAPYVSNALRLLELPKPVQRLIADGKLSAAHGKVLAGLDSSVQAGIAERAVERSLSAHELEREAEWMAQREANSAEDVARQRKQGAERLTKALAALAKRRVPQDAAIVCTGWAGPTELAKGLRKAGFTKAATESGYHPPKPATAHCDCTAWQVDVSGGGPAVMPACVVPAHREAESKTKEKDAESKRARTVLATKAIATAIATELADHPVPRRTAQVLLLGAIGSWQGDDWANRRPGAGTGKKPDVWGAIEGLSDEDLAKEIASRLADRLPYGAPVERIAAAIAQKKEAA